MSKAAASNGRRRARLVARSRRVWRLGRQVVFDATRIHERDALLADFRGALQGMSR